MPDRIELVTELRDQDLPEEILGYMPSPPGVFEPDDAVTLRWAPTATSLSMRSWKLGDLEFCLIEADDSVHAQPSRSSRRNGLFIGMCLAGEITVRQPGRSVQLTPGRFTVFRASDAGSIDAAGSHSWLVVGLEFTRRESSLLPVDESAVGSLGDLPGAEALALLMREVSPPPPGMSPLAQRHYADAIRSLVCGLLVSRSSARATTEDHFARLTAWIEDHLRDEIDATAVARAGHLSVGHVRRIFAQHRTTVAGYIRAARLDRLRDDLVNPAFADHTVSALAEGWRLNTPASVSRAFKDRFGESPRGYRASSAREPDREWVFAKPPSWRSTSGGRIADEDPA